jgi:transposase
VGDQHIRISLDLAAVRVIEQAVTEAGVTVVVEPTVPGASCPQCGGWTAKCHDRRRRVKADEPLGARQVTLVVVRRRFRCLPCGSRFTEADPVCGARRRLTRRLRARLGQEGSRRPVAHVARSYGISPTTVRRAVQEYGARAVVAAAPGSVRRLGLDDFSLRRGRRYATGFHDLDTHRLLEVVEGRTSAAVQPALERLAAQQPITAVSIDMAVAYRAAVQLVLPDARITADKFHVIKRVQEALAAVCRRVSLGLSRADPRRQETRLALRNREDLDPAQRQQLDARLRQHPDLRRAWLLKEDFRRWYRTATASGARLELRAWLRMATATDAPPEFQALAGMFRLWGEEILNYFTDRVTQGVVEGNNNRAKVIQRQAYGYRNFANYRLRLLLAS